MKYMQEERGSIAVFLLICLLPMLMFEGLILDGVRLLACKGNVADAGQLALNGALAGYNRDLKNAYGLYAITDVDQARKDASDYFRRTVDPQGSGVSGTEDTSSFLNMSARVDAGGQEGSELSSTDVLETQIYHQMHYFTSTAKEELKYTYDGTEALYGAYVLIRDKCLFDRELSILARRKNRSVSYLASLYDSWEKCVTMVEVSENMRTRMQEELDEAKLLLEVMQTRYEERNKAMDELSEEGLLTDELTEHFIDTDPEEEPPSEAAEKKDSELRTMFAYGDMEHTTFSNFSERYTDIESDITPDWTDVILDANGSYDEMMDDCLSTLGTQAIRYGSGYARSIKSMVEFGGSIEECTALYASTMFSCYISPTKSLTGNNHFRDGGLLSKNAYSEIEYILCGGADPNKNVQYCMRALQGYLTMWCMVENYMTDTVDRNDALQNAEILADGTSLAIPYFQDLFLMANAVQRGWEKMNQTLSKEGGYCCSIYQGHAVRNMDYQMFLQLLLFRDMYNNYWVYLKRIRSVIEMNMQYAGYTNFSFDTAYTMLWIDAEVEVPTLLLPKQTWHYKNIAVLE